MPLGLAVKSQLKCDVKAPSHMTAKLPKVGRLVGSQKEEQQKEGDSRLGVQGRGARASERGRGSRQGWGSLVLADLSVNHGCWLG